MNIAAWLARNAKSFGDRPGISAGTKIHSTYAQWAQHAAAIAGSLGALTPGDAGTPISTAKAIVQMAQNEPMMRPEEVPLARCSAATRVIQ